MNQQQVATRNIKLYIFIKIFAKRVFLPLSAIYFIDNAGFTIRDIGLLSAFYSLVQLVAEVPTGYFADKIGRIVSIRVGAILCGIGTLIYVFAHAKGFIYVGTLFEALGYSFMGGAGEALIHDSLIVKKQEHNYTRVLSRAQSISLIANAILIALVPMTYILNPSYPFIIGTLCYLALFTFALFMKDVDRVTNIKKFSLPVFSKIVGRRNMLAFGLTFGIIGALYTTPADMFNVALKEYGIRPDLLGWVYSLGSILGVAIGQIAHYLKNLRLSSYLFLDLSLLLGPFIAAATGSAPLLGLTIIMSISFWRYRKIIYQNYLLDIFPTNFKATLISSLNNLEQLNAVWLPLAITFVISQLGVSRGLGVIGLFGLFIAPIFYFATLRFFAKKDLLVV